VRRDALIASGCLHVAIVALAYFGLPSLFHPAPILDSGPVSVEVVTLPAKEPAPPPPAAKPAPDPPRPKPPPPEKAAPPPPPPPDPEPVKAPEPEAVPLPIPKPKAVEAPAPKPKPAPVKEAKIPPRPKHKPKPPSKQASLASLLKDIRKDLKPAPAKPEKAPAKPKALVKDLVAGLEAPPRPAAPASPSPLAQRETSQIAEAVRSQITPCWAVPAGAKDARDMRIGIRIALNPDGTLRGIPSIEDQGRMGADPVFRAFAESALRAIQNPRCSPLRLPTDRYATWSDMTIVFDPRELVGP
jgi:hypothetical protein